MKKISKLKIDLSPLIILVALAALFNVKTAMEKTTQNKAVYQVHRLEEEIIIDGKWEKPVWKNIKPVEITHQMGTSPKFTPTTRVKLLYDDAYIYGIFQVQDKYVQCLVQEINGPVSGDSCVEFFFSPDEKLPLHYFNLEINCGGIPLVHYVTVPRKEYIQLKETEIEKIEIAHSMPRKVSPEVAKDTTWTIEFKVPLKILQEYSEVSMPKPGVVWQANFYKTGSKTSNPHYLTWSPVDNPKPDFHLPRFFGSIEFQ